MNADLFFDVKAFLGEGAIWDCFINKLLWVDIDGQTLNILDVDTIENKAIEVHKKIGTVVSIDAKKALVALEDGLATVDFEDGRIEYQSKTILHLANNSRFNDGKCDPMGRFWVGTLSMDGVKNVSALYCVGKDFSLEKKIDGVSISNGICWDIKRSLMYYIDTPTGTIVQFDYNKENATISNKKEIIKIEPKLGFPDGMTIDEEGMLWVALWDGFCVVRINPISGKVLKKVNVPAPKVTSCAFGGENFSTLYITTARVEMDKDELAQYPLSGSVFSCSVGVKGIRAFSLREDYSL